MGGCISSINDARENSARFNYNPIHKIMQTNSIEALRSKWKQQQLRTISRKVQNFQKTTISEEQFCLLFPKIMNFSKPTQHKIYELFAYQGKKGQLTKVQLINTLTLVRKVQSNKDFAPFLFYIYTNDPSQSKMTLEELKFFQQENQSYVAQAQELQEFFSQLQEINEPSKIKQSDGAHKLDHIADQASKENKKGKTQDTSGNRFKKHQNGVSKKDSKQQVTNKMGLKKLLSIEGKGEMKSISFQFFTEIFEKYNLVAYQILFSWDPQEEQKQLVDKISLTGIIRKKGQKVYILEYHWWLSWKTYVEYKFNKLIRIDEENHNYASTKIQSKRHSNNSKMAQPIKHINKDNPERPGQIKNNCLLKRSRTRGIELMEYLIQFDNYICLPEDVWNKLVAIYHGGPLIQRIYPQIYYNLVLKVTLDAEGVFKYKQMKKYTSKDKKTVKQFANSNQLRYFVYYKYPGRNNWLKYQSENSQEQFFNCPKTYLVFVPPRLQKYFTNLYNIEQTKEGKLLKQRFLNYGSQINLSVEGVLTKAEVTQLLSFDEIKVSYNDDYAVAKSTIVKIDQNLRTLNPNLIEKESLLNEFTGLANIGNTCYMNAVLQCLIRTPSFGSYLEQQNFKDKKKDEQILLEQILNIYTVSKTNSQQVINTRNFKRVFDKFCPFFEGNLQHDAQQFLICLLERLSQEIKSKKEEYGSGEIRLSNQKNNQMQKSVNKKVVQFFSGKTLAITECMLCKNKNKRVQPFFTYSLSLPQLQQTQYFYYFVQDVQKAKSTVPIRYGITLSRKVTIEQFLLQIAKVHKKDIQNIALYTIFNNEILNKLEPRSWQNEIAHHLNFDVKLVCYEFKHMVTPTYLHYKQRRLENKSVKIEIRQRVYSQKTNDYRSTYLPMFMEVTLEMKWQNLIKKIDLLISKLYLNGPTPEPITTSGIRIAEADIQLQLLASNGLKGTNRKSNSEVKNTSSNSHSVHHQRYKIRVIKTDHYYENFCMFCKEEFILRRRSRGTRTCNGQKCKFNPSIPLFEDQDFRNYNDLIIFTVDWQDLPELAPFNNHPSYSSALSRAENRKNFLEDLLINNFRNKEKLELKCQKKQCCHEYVQRIEKIQVPPNILLLHLKRFSYEDNRLLKLTNHVIYPSRLNLPGTQEQYQLYAVVVHIGSGVGGHYISYVHVKNKWYKCDDSKVTLAGPMQHIDPNAYLLFYKKVDFEPSLICLSI